MGLALLRKRERAEMCHIYKNMVHFCGHLALAHLWQPSANTSTLVPQRICAWVVVRIVFLQEGIPYFTLYVCYKMQHT